MTRMTVTLLLLCGKPLLNAEGQRYFKRVADLNRTSVRQTILRAREKRGLCYICQRAGHYAKDCSARAESSASAPAPVAFEASGRECFLCGRAGHVGRDCPLYRESCMICGARGHVGRDCPDEQRCWSTECTRYRPHRVADCPLKHPTLPRGGHPGRGSGSTGRGSGGNDTGRGSSGQAPTRGGHGGRWRGRGGGHGRGKERGSERGSYSGRSKN